MALICGTSAEWRAGLRNAQCVCLCWTRLSVTQRVTLKAKQNHIRHAVAPLTLRLLSVCSVRDANGGRNARYQPVYLFTCLLKFTVSFSQMKTENCCRRHHVSISSSADGDSLLPARDELCLLLH